MDELLLNRTERTALRVKAMVAYEKTAQTIPWPTWCDEWLCRAQVRKVARWLEKHNHADVFPALSGDMLIRGSDMQALRAAAEEVRG